MISSFNEGAFNEGAFDEEVFNKEVNTLEFEVNEEKPKMAKKLKLRLVDWFAV